MAGEGALTEALALLRDPSRRHALRGRALPADIGRLLGLLAGSPLKLDAAATEVGVPAGELLDAVRFYAQEVLLHPAADARRVLGLNPGDDNDVAKRHFRALQAWLHPDRAHGAAEAVFATRVNTAWAACRNDNCSPLAPSADAHPVEHGESPLARMPRWQRLESAPEWLSAQSLVPLALLVACAAMLWVATRPTPVPTLPEPTVLASTDAPPEGASDAAIPTAPDSAPNMAATGASGRASPPQPASPSQPEHVPAMAAGEAFALQARQRRVEPETAAPLRLLGQQPVPDAPRVKELPAKQPTTKRSPAAKAATVAAASTSPAAEPQPALTEHTEAARQRAQTLLAFLLRKNAAPPPIWRNATALESAETARTVLTEGAVFRRPRVQEQGVRWTLGQDEVRVRIPVTPAQRGQAPRTVDATLQWHDNQWWVSALALEAAP